MRRNRSYFMLVFILTWAGCQTYEERPLVPSHILEEVEASRRLLERDMTGGEVSGSAFTFRTAADYLDRSSPHLKRARADFYQAWSLSQISTPLPNPSISGGPQLGSNLDSEGHSRRLQPMVDFGFTLPLSARRAYADDLNQAFMDEAWTRLLAEHRIRYLELHALYTEWTLARQGMEVQAHIRESSKRSLEMTRRLVDAGAAGALDLGLMELEAAQVEHEYLDHRIEVVEREEALSRLMGIHGDLFRGSALPDLPSLDFEMPGLEEAKEIMTANHPGLAILRARYTVAEGQLRLEIEKQYPDLDLGASYEGDPGERKKVWGLSLGIEIPLFDRNEQAIDQARGEREKIRFEYEASLTESLATLESLYALYALGREKRKLVDEVELPRARKNLDVALAAMQAAALDSLKYLEVERTLRAVLADAINVESELRKTLSDMEQIVGVPLLFFPGEEPEDYPYLPAKLQKPVEGEEELPPEHGWETME